MLPGTAQLQSELRTLNCSIFKVHAEASHNGLVTEIKGNVSHHHSSASKYQLSVSLDCIGLRQTHTSVSLIYKFAVFYQTEKLCVYQGVALK